MKAQGVTFCEMSDATREEFTQMVADHKAAFESAGLIEAGWWERIQALDE